MTTILFIASIILCLIGLGLFLHASYKYGKAQGIIDSVALVMSRIKIENKVIESQPSNLPKVEEKEEKPSRTVIKGFTGLTIGKKNLPSYEDNIKNATYSGVLHTFKRDGKYKERPIMTYKWLDEDVFFEYAEDGTPVRIAHEARKQVLDVLRGEKRRNFKAYALK